MQVVVAWVLLIALMPAGLAGQPADDFVSSLVGAWQGRAVRTPVGPVPYNVSFAKTEHDCVSGVVTNQLSHHTWKFCAHGEQLRLRFLTDFRGNDMPINFTQTVAACGVRSFYADSHPFMRLRVFVESDRGWIKVIHHGKLHVEIHLSREAKAH